MEPQASSIEETTFHSESRDGSGAGDHDLPFHFGRTPRAAAPYPFGTRTYARLLTLRSRVQAGLACTDDLSAER